MKKVSANRSAFALPIHLLLVIALLFASAPESAVAAKKKTKAIKAGNLSYVNVSVKVKGKKTKGKVYCYKSKAGLAKKMKGGYSFSTFSTLMKQSPGKSALYNALNKAGKSICSSGGGTPLGTPNLPEYLSLAPYTGPFGAEQARTLFDRFGWSAPPERIAQAVSDGLAKTIEKLTTYVAEPGLDADEMTMRCHRVLPGDERFGQEDFKCDPNNVNSIRFDGLKGAMLYRHLYSANPFFDRLEFFLRDRFQSVDTRVIEYSWRAWSVTPYIDLVRRAARSGDYVQYIRDFIKDYFAAVIWLHLLDSNSEEPNEDEAREILQLGGTGAKNLDGTPVYGDVDIAQVAMALTGWTEDCDHDLNNGHGRCDASFSETRHSPGPHYVFVGTPYQRQIVTADDVIDAIAAHPRLAERIAEQIFDDFINPFATPTAIRAFAKIIRANDYNMIKVFRVVMRSKAVFASQSRKSIPKQPLEFMIGFLRITKIPYTRDFYDDLTNEALRLGQLDLSPPTVFGWAHRDALAGEGNVLRRRNVILRLINQDQGDLKEHGFTYWDRFLSGISGPGAARQFVDNLAAMFNVHLNQTQRADFIKLLDYNLRDCNQWSNCSPGQLTYQEEDAMNASVDNPENGRYGYQAPDGHTIYPSSNEVRLAIRMMANMPEFMMK